MFIKIDPAALRTALQALRTLYTPDCPLFYSVEGERFVFESTGGTHRFNISFAAGGVDTLPLQKTTVGAFTQRLSLLDEYPDLTVTEAAITDETELKAAALLIIKKQKKNKDDTEECLALSKRLSTTNISDNERVSLEKCRESYGGEVAFTCPGSISVAAHKANIIKASALYIRGKRVYCSSGDGICRIATPELADDLEQNVDAAFMFDITKLGAEKYDFYSSAPDQDYVTCTVGDVMFKLGVPRKAPDNQISKAVLSLFDEITAEARVYYKEIRALYGGGAIRVLADKAIMLAEGTTKLSAPFILPLKDEISGVAISEAVAKAAGDVWTVGVSAHNARPVALVTGDCDIVFNAHT